jgi:hypothetical protein
MQQAQHRVVCVRKVRAGDPLGTLEALLEGTGLGYRVVNERTVVVR